MATPTQPLSSTTVTNLPPAFSLPSEVVACLKNARFLHLGTCDELFPHVSLMNYTYLPSTPFTPNPVVIMTTSPSSKKTQHMAKNPHVSLLVHDWVSHRPPTRPSDAGVEGSPPRPAPRSSLASMLLDLNSSSLSRISATINGVARLVSQGSDEEAWYKALHVENNSFEDQAQGGVGLQGAPGSQGSGRDWTIEGEEVRVVVVQPQDGSIADWKGGVKDWSLEDTVSEDRGRQQPLVNGV
ncbi:hypothetical protein L228DRAFT_241938 [Xylona heveae TC161]|uniref:Pyridoxamine 5'-phosphate oxidase N-terminal domain-containing protein n=1 Tax=Xylona heveae (strain CBS 132557 / TC161) TaxID=1328760 RepID=A0A164ZME9_XYLHT|nr:hypothetical protein L228DRAFT_241938 [Xylona heveae TC161]KZF19278.1 hypothetical protein L228DRAFT_241938 [Xylona heveae TC161]